MNYLFSDYIGRFMDVYLDDIIIYSKDAKSHESDVKAVLERLRQYKLYAKLSKCAFEVDRVRFLGFIVSSKGVSMEQDRVATIRDWPEPKNVREVKQFLGFANFYRRFIEGYSRKAKALSDLEKDTISGQGQVFKFTPEARKAFESLKQAFCEAPVLRHYDPEKPLRVEIDALNFAISGIVS